MKSKEPQSNSSSKTRVSYSANYPGARVSSVEALGSALGKSLDELHILIEKAPTCYRLKEEKTKPDGSKRRIFSLNSQLKATQQLINDRFLKRCRYPRYISGSIKGCDYIANASRHTRQATVIKLDVTNFFPSISESMIELIWRDFFNFSPDVSEVLRALCCHEGGLVQGAPVSSYLANLVFWDIEPLLAKQFEEEGLIYTRYVDDMILSHHKKLSLVEKSKIIQRVKLMLCNKGLKAKTRKTKVMDARGPQIVHGLNVNGSRATVPKTRRKQIRAAVHRLITDTRGLDSEAEAKEVARVRGQLFNLRRTHKAAAQKLLDKVHSNISSTKL